MQEFDDKCVCRKPLSKNTIGIQTYFNCTKCGSLHKIETEETDAVTIEQIHTTSINGQWRQLARQIAEYMENNGQVDFWEDYADYLKNCYENYTAIHDYFATAIKYYFRYNCVKEVKI
jgi:dimeric dUTPase (all-alpha-NTP-PPase superfamily)